jgi:hypothetical protein
MKHIVVVTDELYYQWQTEVMLNNFERIGIDDTVIIVVGERNLNWMRLEAKYNKVSFSYYTDPLKGGRSYVSSARFYGLRCHYELYPELKDEWVFYHDCDVVFKKVPNIVPSGDRWLVSDTVSYIGYDYIVSKGDGIYDLMCSIVGIDPEIPKQRVEYSGGAQYILRGVDANFWRKCERESSIMYTNVGRIGQYLHDNDKSYNPLQIWCADMWALLWNAWLHGFETEVSKEMDFCFATDPIKKDCNIIHNAGVTRSDIYFDKSQYRNSTPYGDVGVVEGKISKDHISYKYFAEVKETAKNTVLINRGVGDSLEAFFESINVPSILKKAGLEDCGCKERKEFLNKLIPYK